MARIDEIRKLLGNDPNDVFLNYSLAMELHAADQSADALAQIERTIELDGNYLAAYVKKAEWLIAEGRADDAASTLRTAARIAEEIGDHHMLENVRESLAMLE